jgi:hypothetical protein
MVMPSLRRSQIVLKGLSYGLERLGPYPATRWGQTPHWLDLVTGVGSVVAYSSDLALKLGMAVAEEMHDCQGRVGWGKVDRGVMKDLQD